MNDNSNPNNSKLTARFDPNDEKTWPVLCDMHEVAAVLRFKNHRTARKLTTVPPGEGGLPFVPRGKARFVHRDDLKAFVGRRHTASPKYQAPPRKKPTRSSITAGLGPIAQALAQRNKAA